jgi:hypothetical protein
MRLIALKTAAGEVVINEDKIITIRELQTADHEHDTIIVLDGGQTVTVDEPLADVLKRIAGEGISSLY